MNFLDSRYFNNLNYNLFTSKTQLAVIGKFNNINITGSNIQDFLENVDAMSEDSDDDAIEGKTNSLSGFLKTGVTGFNIGHEFKKEESFNADYFYNLSDNKGKSNSKRISFVNNNNFDYEDEDDYDKVSNNHNLNFNYENKSNKTKGLTIKGKVTSDKTISNSNILGTYTTEEGELATTNDRSLRNSSDKNSIVLKFNFYQNLPKKGRNFSTGLTINYFIEIENNNGKTLHKPIVAPKHFYSFSID